MGRAQYALSMQWQVQEGHLQGEVNQLSKDRDDAQKQCADLQRRHAQAQHEIRRKVSKPCQLLKAALHSAIYNFSNEPVLDSEQSYRPR